MATVAVYDESYALTELIGKMLEMFGYRAVLFENITSLAEAILLEKFDLVMVESKDGWKILGQQKAVPVVIMASYLDDEIEQVLYRLGAIRVMRMPITVQDVLDTVRELV